MRVLVFGGTGATGRLFVERALAANHEVTAFVRDPAKARLGNRVRTLRGDARNAALVAAAVPGHDAVVCLLGPTGRERFTHFIGNAVRAMLTSMESSGVRRFLLVSAVGVGDSRREAPALFRYLVIPVLLRATYADRSEAERVVKASRLDWTIVRPLYLTNGPATGRARVAARGTHVPPRLPRADLAHVLTDELESKMHIRQAIAVGAA